MSNFRSMMSKLRVSKETNDSSTEGKTKFLLPSIGNTYNVRLLPYLTESNVPQTINEFWSHKVNGVKHLCSGKFNGCELCEAGDKAQINRYANVQVIKSTDKKFKDGEYYVLPIHWALFNILNDYEKDNSLSLFDVYGAGEVSIKVTTGSYEGGGKYPLYDETTISSVILAISPEIENYNDDQIISFIKEFTYNLDLIVANLPQYKNSESVFEKAPTILTKKEVVEKTTSFEKKDVVSKSIKDKMLEIDNDDELDEDFIEKLESKISNKNTEKTTSDDADDTESYISDFMNSIED